LFYEKLASVRNAHQGGKYRDRRYLRKLSLGTDGCSAEARS